MKLLLAEDTNDLNRAVTAVLSHEGYDVDSVYDGDTALDHILTNGYDAVILDIMMPGLDGITVLKEMRQRRIHIPVMLLTAKAEVDDRVNGLDAGADDYLPKPFAMKELLARVRSMTRRSKEYEPRKLEYADLVLDSSDLSISARNAVRLSLKEFELIQLLLSNTDISHSSAALLEKLWNDEKDSDDDTVWLYVKYLNNKLSSIGSRVSISGEHGGAFRIEETDT
jgi:DNA-binding response OmpR family regulator